MPETATQCRNQTATDTTNRFARAALELHRLALTASEVSHLPSPATPREKTKRGASDPTATTAMDERREAVATALHEVGRIAERLLLSEDMGSAFARLTAALNHWDGKR